MPESKADGGGIPTVNVPFSLPVGPGYLHASAQLPAGSTTMTELLPVIRNLESAITQKVSEEAQAAGCPISCRAGCAHCCRHLVPLSVFEAEALARWLLSLPEKVRADLEGRFQRALTALSDAGVLQKLVDLQTNPKLDSDLEVGLEYHRAYVACPFLENENCGIYSIRPLACREYMVTSPPELCRDPAANDLLGVILPLRLSHVLFSFGRRLARDPRGYIPLVFLFAWARSGAKPGDLVAGTGEEVLKRFLDEVTTVAESQKTRTAENGAAPPDRPS